MGPSLTPDGDAKRGDTSVAMPKTLPPFLDSEETYHFFNDDVVLRTNAIRTLDDEDEDGEEAEGTAYNGDEQERDDDDDDDEDRRRRDADESESVGSEDDDEDDDYDDEDEDDGEDEEDGALVIHRNAIAKCKSTRKKRKQHWRMRTKITSAMLKRNSLRSERIPDPAPMYDEIYDSFDDLYVGYYAQSNDVQRKDWEQKQQNKTRRARAALAAYTRRAFAAKSYRYRKQCEFLRVCYQRALETEPLVEERAGSVGKEALGEKCDKSVHEDGEPPRSSSSLLSGIVRKDDVVETTTPTLYPRKWPHLPFRSPLLWKDNVDDAVEFLSKLSELPETSLLYEPIDVQGFTKEVVALLEAVGVDLSMDTRGSEYKNPGTETQQLPEEAVAGLAALLGMGVQLQSFSLLSFAALHLTALGCGTLLGEAGVVRPRLQNVLSMYWSRFVNYASGPSYAATYSRGLLSQWKMSACQPSSSDAIATDGLFLYVFDRSGLLKIGTGNGVTVRDFVYDHNREYTRSRDAERSWLCCIGNYLYCRTIVMPSNRVDRIDINNLNSVEELFFSPNRDIQGKGVSESSVYAMVTDGIDLYTIKCIDTHKCSIQEKKEELAKSRLSNPIDHAIDRILNSEHHKSEEKAKELSSKGDGSDIQIGDRVMRGPDWKWSNQDGEKGSFGTVERISTWGGVAGSGVTVRWDKTQRVNTYRWGAEDCYDLIIVIEKDGQIIEQKKLPSKATQPNEAGGNSAEGHLSPRHHFMLFRHSVSQIVSTIDLEDDDIDHFLDLSPMCSEEDESPRESPGLSVAETSLLSSLHSHTLSLRESKSSWMCDGRLPTCNGDNASKRYQCDSGCDYDLCESCILSSLKLQEPTPAASSVVISEEQVQESEGSSQTTEDSAESRVDGAVDPAATEGRSVDTSSKNLDSNPFAILHASLVHDEEGGRRDEADEPTKDDPREKEDDLVSELFAFWGGLYTRKECRIALRRNNFSLSEASVWIDECSSDLRKKLLVPTVSSVNLTAKVGTNFLDPVLLIAGSFYISHGQLCIVSPPGIYTAGETQSEPMKRAVKSCDAAWFFSIDSGTLLVNEKTPLPVLLKGIPAGSPTCVDTTRGSILVYSGYLNCLEVYVDPAHTVENSLAQPSLDCCEKITSLADMGKKIFSQLHNLMLRRWSFPAYKQARAGLQDILFKTEREPVQATSKTAKSGGENDGAAGQKSKARRIKNIRARIKMLEQIGQRDPLGYVIPFSVDFRDDGVLNLFRALYFWGNSCCSSEESALDVTLCSLVKDVLGLLSEITCEFDYAGLSICGEAVDTSTKNLYEGVEKVLSDLARGRNMLPISRQIDDSLGELQQKVILSAQTVLVWGARKGLFCREGKAMLIGSIGGKILVSLERDQSLLSSKSLRGVAESARESVRFANELDCEYGLLQNLLYCPTDPGRIDIADFMPMTLEDFSHLVSTLFKLSMLEFKGMALQNQCEQYGSRKITPVTKVLHSLMNYCSVRLYGERDEALNGESNSTESKRVNALELFDLYALTCIRYSSELLEQVGSAPIFQHTERSHLKSSFIGTILPIVLATISNFPAYVSPKVRNNLAELMRQIHQLSVRDGEQLRERNEPESAPTAPCFDGDQIVESAHPYNQNQSSFRRVVRIPGATLLHIDFDPRCCTSGEADFVFITSGRSWFNSDRMAFADGGIGDNGGCFFGSYHRGNWPTQGLSVLGDTVTIMLCATSQARDNADHTEQLRWGLRCTVRGLFSRSHLSWLGDISDAVASTSSVIVEALIQSIPEQQVEVQCRKWMGCRELFDCTDSAFYLNPKMLAFVHEVAENTGHGNTFVKRLTQRVRLHKSPNTSMNSKWSEAVHLVAAVLVAQTDKVQLAAMLKALETDTFSDDGIENSVVKFVAAELLRVEQWMLRQVQLLNEWHYLQVDGVTVEEMTERYADNHDRLRELCELRDIVYNSIDVNGCIKKLHAHLHKQDAHAKDDMASQASAAYQCVANEIIKKAQFLMDRGMSVVTNVPQAADDAKSQPIGVKDAMNVSCFLNRPHQDRVVVAGEFLRCSIPSTAITQCAQIHSKRLKERLAGFYLSEFALSGIEAMDVRTWFVGRGLVALSSSNCFDLGYFTGCMLGDRTLLTEFAAILGKSEIFTMNLLNDKQKPHALRSIALADSFCAMQLTDRGKTVEGLDCAANLVSSIDGTSANESMKNSHTSNIGWILYRLHHDQVYDGISSLDKPQQDIMKSKAALIARTLYTHYERMKTFGTRVGEVNWRLTSNKMISRILCSVMAALNAIVERKEDFVWWVERLVELVVRQEHSTSLSISAARVFRKILDLCGDRLVDLEINISGLRNKTACINLGRELPRVFFERVGELLSLLPATDNDLKEQEGGDSYHVLVFQNEDAHSKMGDAIEKVREPDISHLDLQLHTSEPDEGQKVAESTSADSSIIHRSHSLDHEFVRLLDSSSGMGDLLRPRSKGGGTVPETSLVGSKHWKGSVIKVELAAKGYAPYCVGSAAECLATAKGLAELGFMTTVVHKNDLRDIDCTYSWENQVSTLVEPGSARSGRRSSSTKSALQKLERTSINSFNNKVCVKGCNSRWIRRRRMDDVRALASEMIAIMRSFLDDEKNLVKWKSRFMKTITDVLDGASNLLELPSLSGSEDRLKYFAAVGAANVLGGFNEPLRVGGSVERRSTTRSERGDLGILQMYAFGNDVVSVYSGHLLSRRDVQARESVTETTVSDIVPVSEVPVSNAVIKSLENLTPSFCSLIKILYGWMTASTVVTADGEFGDSLHRSELGCALMRAFSGMAPLWSSLFDNQIISTHGNIPFLLFKLAQFCLKDVSLNEVEEKRNVAWQTQWICSKALQNSVATRPIKRSSFSSAENTDCIFRPSPEDSRDVNECSSEHFYNMYAYSSRADIAQHSSRNKLLEYWEKNVIPAIESYVSGSFKSYEMDYFFAQLREPLREGNSAAALKIAYTLCDGHVPSGCVYPDRDTDWSALQVDEIEIGGRYLISAEDFGDSGWPREMIWTIGHSGVVRVVHPSGMLLLEVMNPVSSTMEYWWYHVDNLKPCATSIHSFSDQSIADFGECENRLLKMNKHLICSIARKSVFDLLQVAPDHVMSLSIDRKSQRQESASENRYELGDLLKLAATADLGCPDKVAESEAFCAEVDIGESSSSPRGVGSSRYPHVPMLQKILSKHFDQTVEIKTTQRLPDEVLPLITKKKTKPVKGSGVSSSSLKPAQGKLCQPDAEPPASPIKYRFMLMESLLRELKKCLDNSTSFLQRNSFTVTSESPPKRVVLVHVPDATCLVISFVVHPVLMDLPAGSSLEFFRDEQCTDRIFGYFGEKKGLNYLPPLVVPGDRCYVKTSQGMYARYKFRVDALTSDFGLALWIGEELYHKLITISFTGYEIETLLSNLLNAFVKYLGTATCLPMSAKTPVFQLVAKLVNFALGKGILGAVPIAKLSSDLVKELTIVYDNERTTQKGLFSLYTQQLAELISLIEEVSYLKGGTSPIVSGSWWSEFVRMAAFTRVLAQGKREISNPEAFNRIYCGRAPIQEIKIAHLALSGTDLFSQRLIVLQKLPKTTRVTELQASLSRFILHLSLEECGEADDQSVYSAAEVTRFGLFSKVLYLPVDADGVTKGYAIVDVGREDIIINLISRVSQEKFEFEGERTSDDSELASRIASLAEKASNNFTGRADEADAAQEDQVWSCSVCTLENSVSESECAACGSPIPDELANIARARTNQSESENVPAQLSTSSSDGWACYACTFLNGWSDSQCIACGSERSADLVPPSLTSETNVLSDASQPSSADSDTNIFHELSALRFADALCVAQEVEVPQVRGFLRKLFVASENDGKKGLVEAFSSVLQSEASQYGSSAESKKTIEAFAALVGMDSRCDRLPADELIRKLVSSGVDTAETKPVEIYQWLRSSGYDLQFDLNHYPSADAALHSQTKWTFQMDCQLIAMSKALSSSIGVLTLSELCPSHISARKHAKDYSLLASLETRDLRLRFAILKTLNRLLLDALPLVNLRPWSDPNSLRNRIVSIRQVVFPGVKIRFFAQTQDNTSFGCSMHSAESGAKRPMVTLDRRKIFGRRSPGSPLPLDDPKKSLFGSVMKQLSTINPSLLRAKRPTGASDPFVAFIVNFAGENVVGEGGPYRQLFNDISNELLSPGNPLFIPTQNNVMKIGEYRERYIPKPSSTSKDMLKMYEFVGLLMGCCLRTGVRLNIRLAPIVWKMLVKQSLAFTDLESVDFSLCESLKYLEALVAEGGLASDDVIYESFTSTLSDGTLVELKPNGSSIPVTKENCKDYIRLVKATRLQECKPQVDAILRGIGKIVPVQLLQLCVWSELQQWICGSLDINVELLKVPPATTKNQDDLLPKADTCFFNIELPAYSTEEIMREKLLLAITLCTSLDGDDQAGHLSIYYAGEDDDGDY
ncbi:Hect-domain containing peotein, partial [Globisporangium splendens]